MTHERRTAPFRRCRRKRAATTLRRTICRPRGEDVGRKGRSEGHERRLQLAGSLAPTRIHARLVSYSAIPPRAIAANWSPCPRYVATFEAAISRCCAPSLSFRLGHRLLAAGFQEPFGAAIVVVGVGLQRTFGAWKLLSIIRIRPWSSFPGGAFPGNGPKSAHPRAVSLRPGFARRIPNGRGFATAPAAARCIP